MQIERRALAPRIQVRITSEAADPRLDQLFRLTERGLQDLVGHARVLEAGAAKTEQNVHLQSPRDMANWRKANFES